MEAPRLEDSNIYSILESKTQLEKATSTQEVLKTYGMVDLSNIDESGLCGWQDDCGRKAAETKGGEQVAIEFFKMANETRNRQRTGQETKDFKKAINDISNGLVSELHKS